MKFHELIEIIGREPVFETGLLLAGDVNPVDIRRQLSRWMQTGRLYQLRRGLYALAPPYQKIKPHPFHIANRMVQGSYVSLQSALAYAHLIPEHVPTVTSVTTGRPGHWNTPLGRFEFRHIRTSLFYGYRLNDLGGDQKAFVSTPEKALLDLVYLQPDGDRFDYLSELRLQHTDTLALQTLQQFAERAESPKLCRAADRITELVYADQKAFETI